MLTSLCFAFFFKKMYQPCEYPYLLPLKHHTHLALARTPSPMRTCPRHRACPCRPRPGPCTHALALAHARPGPWPMHPCPCPHARPRPFAHPPPTPSPSPTPWLSHAPSHYLDMVSLTIIMYIYSILYTSQHNFLSNFFLYHLQIENDSKILDLRILDL